MSDARFCGHKTGFNPSGENTVTPNFEGVKTNFTGRGAVPSGKLKVPAGYANLENGNRRLAKTRVAGDGASMNAPVRGTNAFSRGGKSKRK